MNSLYDNAYFYALSSLIRISAGHRIFAPYRSFSQLVTSFFGAMYQGILRMLFVAWSFSLNSIFSLYSSSRPSYKNSTLLTRLIIFLQLQDAKLLLLIRINLINLIAFLYFLFFSFLCSCQSSCFNDSWIFWGLDGFNHLMPFGGLKWTRTIDLTLIRRVL